MPHFSLSDVSRMEKDFQSMPLNILRSCVESAVIEMNSEFYDCDEKIEEWVAGDGDGRWKMMNVHGNLMHSSEWQVKLMAAFDKLVDALQRRERDELKAILMRREFNVVAA